jgi:hypothetical protein
LLNFTEKKFEAETEIMAFKYLPDNKQVQELADLYEQLKGETV